jgi:predicted NBD/HSP70 family sugar kinase
VLGAIAGPDRPTRAQIAGRTGLTKTTVSSLVDVLVGAGLVSAGDPDRGLVGRPGSPLDLDPRGPAGLGVEINVDYCAATIVDFAGQVRAEWSEASDHRRLPPGEVLDRAAALGRRALEAVPGVAVAGLAVAVPGLVDLDGRLRRAPNLPGWEDLDVARELEARLGTDFALLECDNEANLAALAERWFAEPASRDFVHVSGEIGVGAGIVVNGALWRGASGLGAELGHVMVDPGGPRCTCGARGCLEQVAGLEALVRAAGGPAGAPGSDLGRAREELVRRARSGDPETLAALGRAGAALGAALAALVNLIGVSSIILGGVYADLAPFIIGRVADELGERVLSHAWAPVTLGVSPLGQGAAVLGAAATPVRRILADPVAWFPEMLTVSAVGG